MIKYSGKGLKYLKSYRIAAEREFGNIPNAGDVYEKSYGVFER